MTKPPRLGARRPLPPAKATVVACVRALADPLTGHRGPDEGAAIVARAGNLDVLLQASTGPGGATLHGLLTSASPDALIGALVHARAEGASALTAASAGGEFTLRGWVGILLAVDIETEDGFWRIDWPREAP